MISQYSAKPEELYPIRNLMQVVGKRLTMRGFIVSDPDMGPKHLAEHQKNVGGWIADGSFKVKTDVTHGMDKAVDGFLGMLQGKNFGKAVIKIAPDEKI
jgi:NADPH-dependent curcumin reductase CurA